MLAITLCLSIMMSMSATSKVDIVKMALTKLLPRAIQGEIYKSVPHRLLISKRPELMFYELDTFDPWGSNPWKRSTVEHKNGSFSGYMNMFARATEFVAPDVKFREAQRIETTSELEAQQAAAQGATEDVPNLLPDG